MAHGRSVGRPGKRGHQPIPAKGSPSHLKRLLAASPRNLGRALASIDKAKLPYLSFSKISDLEFCEYRYVLSYIEGVRPAVEPSYFKKGHSFHQAMAQFYGDVAGGKPPDQSAIRGIFDIYHAEEDRMHLRNAFDLAVQNAHAGWNIVSIEEPFVLDAGGGVSPCLGVIDLVLRREDTFAVVDHKTGKVFGEPDAFQLAIYREHVRRAHGANRCVAMFDQYRWVNSLERIRKPAFQRVTMSEDELDWNVTAERLAVAQARIREIEKGDEARADGPCYMCPLKNDCDRAKPSY